MGQKAHRTAQQCSSAAACIQRQTYGAFCPKTELDKVQQRVERPMIATEAIATTFENTKALRKGGLTVTTNDIAGAGFEPATFGL